MRINIKESLALKLSLYIISAVVITFLSVLVYNYLVSKELILANNEENIKNLEEWKLNQVDQYISTAQNLVENLALFMETSDETESELLYMLKTMVERYPQVYGSTISCEPYMFNKDKYYFAPYFYKKDNILQYKNIGSPKYDYFKMDWYTKPKQLNRGVWGEPYFDEGAGDILMVSYGMPFYKRMNGKRVFFGVIDCDISLDWLVDLISKIKVFKTGYTFVLSDKGIFLAHPNKDYYTKGKSFFSLAKEYNSPTYKTIGENMVSGQAGSIRYYDSPLEKNCYVYYMPLKKTGWSLGIVIPEDELFSKLDSVTLKLFIIGIIGYALTLVLIIVLSSRAIMPLRSLAKATCKIGEGDFNVKIPVQKYKDEIGLLSHSFRIMQGNLMKYIDNLQKITAAKEKIEKELSIAREIQQSLLPHKFPKLKQLDLYAILIPAKEVGGDLYDFFFIDEKHLCFAIGDVSGKGVPAALFMAVTKTLLRAKMSIITMDPAKVFNAMNEELCKENESFMFVTFFLGILNIETGILEYCNAGHTPPLIHTVNKGFYYFHTEAPYPPLGITEDMKYTGNRLKLLPEDIFFLYTDGVTEAMNIDNIQFSEEELLNILGKNKDETVSNIVDNVKTAVEQHSSGAIQSDDITMLIFKYNG